MASAQEPGNYTMLRVPKSFQRSRRDDKMRSYNRYLVIGILYGCECLEIPDLIPGSHPIRCLADHF
jgi:hypothetical protein